MPNEILLAIAKSLPVSDVIALGQSCRAFHDTLIHDFVQTRLAYRDPFIFTRLLFVAIERGDDSLFCRLLRVRHAQIRQDESRWSQLENPVTPDKMLFCSPLPRKDLESIRDAAGRASVVSPITIAHFPDLGLELQCERLLRMSDNNAFSMAAHLPLQDQELVCVSGLSSDSPDLNRHSWCWSPIHVAVIKGNLFQVSKLLELGQKIDTLAYGACNCIMPFSIPCRGSLPGDPSLTRRVSPIRSSIAVTPLHLAICTGNVPMAKLLLQQGASLTVGLPVSSHRPHLIVLPPEFKPANGFHGNTLTALHSAVIRRDPEIVDLVIRSSKFSDAPRVEVNRACFGNMTALHLAIARAPLDEVPRDSMEDVASDPAHDSPFVQVLSRLVDAGAIMAQAPDDPLTMCCLSGKLQHAAYLLSRQPRLCPATPCSDSKRRMYDSALRALCVQDCPWRLVWQLDELRVVVLARRSLRDLPVQARPARLGPLFSSVSTILQMPDVAPVLKCIRVLMTRCNRSVHARPQASAHPVSPAHPSRNAWLSRESPLRHAVKSGFYPVVSHLLGQGIADYEESVTSPEDDLLMLGLDQWASNYSHAQTVRALIPAYEPIRATIPDHFMVGCFSLAASFPTPYARALFIDLQRLRPLEDFSLTDILIIFTGLHLELVANPLEHDLVCLVLEALDKRLARLGSLDAQECPRFLAELKSYFETNALEHTQLVYHRVAETFLLGPARPALVPRASGPVVGGDLSCDSESEPGSGDDRVSEYESDGQYDYDGDSDSHYDSAGESDSGDDIIDDQSSGHDSDSHSDSEEESGSGDDH